MPGLVGGFPAEKKRDIKTTGKIIEIRRVSFAGLIGKPRSDTASKYKELLFTPEAETKKLNVCYTYCSVVFQVFYYSVLSYFRVTIPGNIQAQIGQGSEPAHCGGVGLDDLERSTPTQTTL